jgi:flagellar biogenesis protein FliO
MQSLYQILGLLAAGMIVFLLYRTIKGRPEMFSGENLSKSFSTMGVLALILIVFIAFLIMMLRV